MQIKSLLFIVTSSLTGVALASPWYTVTETITATPPPAGTEVSQCNTGSLQCCNSVQSADSPAVASLLGPLLPLLAIVLGSLDVPVGLACTPISVIGIGSGAGCTEQTACCTGDQFNGLVNIGCTPINL